MLLSDRILEELEKVKQQTNGTLGIGLIKLSEVLKEDRKLVRKELVNLYKDKKVSVYQAVNYPCFMIYKPKPKRRINKRRKKINL